MTKKPSKTDLKYSSPRKCTVKCRCTTRSLSSHRLTLISASAAGPARSRREVFLPFLSSAVRSSLRSFCNFPRTEMRRFWRCGGFEFQIPNSNGMDRDTERCSFTSIGAGTASSLLYLDFLASQLA